MNNVAHMAETGFPPSPLAAFVRGSFRPLSFGCPLWLVLALFAAVVIHYMTRVVGSSSIAPVLLLCYPVASIYVKLPFRAGCQPDILRLDVLFIGSDVSRSHGYKTLQRDNPMDSSEYHPKRTRAYSRHNSSVIPVEETDPMPT